MQGTGSVSWIISVNRVDLSFDWGHFCFVALDIGFNMENNKTESDNQIFLEAFCLWRSGDRNQVVFCISKIILEEPKVKFINFDMVGMGLVNSVNRG